MWPRKQLPMTSFIPSSVPSPALFPDFFIGGFECASQRLRSGVRRDLTSSTLHDRFAYEDYARLHDYGMSTARDGVRWHLIETGPFVYDFSSLAPMVQAARSTRTQVIWDLCHYGWPDDLDIFSPEFVRRFAAFVKAVVRFICSECDSTIFLAPVNEISFFAWAGGESAYLNPFETERAPELKVQLVRAAIEAVEAAWSINPDIRIVHTDPLINVVHNLDRPEEFQTAESYRQGLFEAWDMLAGRQRPDLGGQEKYLDIIGVNYYSNNQWLCGETSFHPERWLEISDKQYRPLRSLLSEVYDRYQRPMFIAETGTEGTERPGWFRYVCEEVRGAMREGVPLEGVCLYPIIDFPGWDDDRHCETGLWGFADENGRREVYLPLAEELIRQQEELSQLHQSTAVLFPSER
jgi:beta-glucosidase/6-phospho-beta-glucosidase/beta-galactosidase